MKIVDRKERESGWKGKNRYFIDYRNQDGKRKTPGFRTKEEAEREFARLRKLKERGWHPSAEADHITFGKAMDAYLEDGGLKFDMRANRKDKWEASTLALKKNAAEKHVRRAVGHFTLARLEKNPQPLQDLIDKLLRAGHVRTPETVAIIINGTIEFAHKRKRWLAHNFLQDDKLELPEKKQKERKMPKPDEFRALMRAVSERAPYEARYAFEYRQLMFALWLTPPFGRRGEVAALFWEDIYPDHVHIHRVYSYQHERMTGEVFKDTTKTDKDRWAPISDLVKAALSPIWIRQGRPTGGLILKAPHRGRPIYGQMREEYFAFTMRKAGLTVPNGRRVGRPLYRLHDMRHLGESMHLERGGHHKQIAEWAGHSEQTLRSVYEHVLAGDERSTMAAAAIANDLERLMLPAPGRSPGDYQYEYRQRRKVGNGKATSIPEK
jgi:hypothetical protein